MSDVLCCKHLLIRRTTTEQEEGKLESARQTLQFLPEKDEDFPSGISRMPCVKSSVVIVSQIGLMDGGALRPQSKDLVASWSSGGKADRSPSSELLVALWFGCEGGTSSESGCAVNGVSSVPA